MPLGQARMADEALQRREPSDKHDHDQQQVGPGEASEPSNCHLESSGRVQDAGAERSDGAGNGGAEAETGHAHDRIGRQVVGRAARAVPRTRRRRRASRGRRDGLSRVSEGCH